jgi:hypothetical protein
VIEERRRPTPITPRNRRSLGSDHVRPAGHRRAGVPRRGLGERRADRAPSSLRCSSIS